MYRALTVAVVMPAHNEARLLRRSLATMPALVDHVLVVDDASEDATAQVCDAWPEARVRCLRHAVNGGVGAAIVTGYRAALALGVDAVVVMAADAQMDPTDLPGLLDALLDEPADYVKGNRLRWPHARRLMPPARYLGTLTLSWLTRLSSGYPELLDSQCGYTVIRREALARLDLDALYPRYGFPNDLLNRLGEQGARLAERPVRPVYADEVSGLRIPRVVGPISGLIARGVWRRLVWPGWGWRRGARPPWAGALLVLCGLVGLLIGAAARPVDAAGGRGAGAAHPSPGVARFHEALEVVVEHHADELSTERLVRGGIDGLIGLLDRHSEYFEVDAYRRWRSRIHGRKTGPGFEVRVVDGRYLIDRISPGSPAEARGLEVGDELLAVDGEPLREATLADVRQRLEGEEGTSLQVRLRRGGDEDVDLVLIQEMTLTRRRVRAIAVTSRLLPGGVAHIAVERYQEGVTQDIIDARRRLQETHGGPLRGVILDVRGNLGGLLREAVSMADAFLPQGQVIVTLESRPGEVVRTHTSHQQMLIDEPVVVLVNERSASASELFAAALQDHGRALIVGGLTYGKGSVQSTYPLLDGSGLKITTSLYFSPDHRKIDGAGVAPDVIVADAAPSGIADVHHDVALDAALGMLRSNHILAGADGARADQAASASPSP